MTQLIGQVSESGAVTIPSNITAGRLSQGVYKVTYLDPKPFNSEPVVVLTALADQGDASGVSISGSTTAGFTVTVKTMGGSLVDRGFNFIAASDE